MDNSAIFILDGGFPQKMAFPTCSNPLSVQSPFIGRVRLHTTQSLCLRIAFSHSSRPSSLKLSHKKTVGPCSLSLPQNLVVPLPAQRKKGGAVTADSLCSCTAENKDCRARGSLQVGDRYPLASRRSCWSPSFRMNALSSLVLLFFFLPQVVVNAAHDRPTILYLRARC